MAGGDAVVVCTFSSTVFQGEELLGTSGVEGTAHVACGVEEELLVVW